MPRTAVATASKSTVKSTVKSVAKPRGKKVNPKTGMFFTPKVHDEPPVDETPVGIRVIELIDPKTHDIVTRAIWAQLLQPSINEYADELLTEIFDEKVGKVIAKRKKAVREAKKACSLAFSDVNQVISQGCHLSPAALHVIFQYYEAAFDKWATEMRILKQCQQFLVNMRDRQEYDHII